MGAWTNPMTRRAMRRAHAALVVLAVAALTQPCCRRGDAPPVMPAAPSVPALRFEDVTRPAGVARSHAKPELDPVLAPIMPWMASVGAAAAAADYDRDGRVDLFVTSSRQGEPNLLYRNRGDGTFEERGAQAGLAKGNDESGASMDAAWGDVDNDGWPDLYVVRWGRDLLYRNLGDGTFEDVTARRFRRADGSPGTDWKNGNAVVFLDFDRDGRLDLYVGNYFADHDLWHLTTTRIMHDDFERARNAGINQLFRQQPDGTFAEIAHAAGVDDPGWTLAVGSADVDGDGWPDLYAANDFGPDKLFINRRDGTFEDQSEHALGTPDTRKGMNVDFGDADGDGWLDIYVTNITTSEYLHEGNMLWRSNGPGADGRVTFTDVGVESGTEDGGWGWGAKFFDADDDGDLDLAQACGFISAGKESYWYDLASWTVTGRDVADAKEWPPIGDRSFSGYEPFRFWRNDGFGTFTERAQEAGLVSTRDGRGVVVLDYDDDGRLDLYVANQGQEPLLFHNTGAGGNHWLRVALEGDPARSTTRDAVGARVAIRAGGAVQVRERDGGNGYCGKADPRIHFGLGTSAVADLLEVRWPDGGVQAIEQVAADRQIVVQQDATKYLTSARIVVPVARGDAAAKLGGASPTEGISSSADPAAATTAPALPRDLDAMERELRSLPRAFAPASAYRALASRLGEHDRAIAFFEALAEDHPDDMRARIELAAALIDEIPTCGGIATVVCKGSLAKRSLDRLDEVVEAQPDSWLAHYMRGMNHLHWPRALRHSADAALDLARCVELQEGGAADAPPRAAGLRCHVALGDALARDGRLDEARAAWRRGLASFPDAASLTERLALADGDVLRHLDRERSLESSIDTDLSFLDAR